MKKIYFLLAALILTGSVQARAWRVCSQTNQHAHFLSVSAAVASDQVLADDTLYIEPGHVELGELYITKKLHLVGPGYNYLLNDINAMDIRNAAFTSVVYLQATGITVSGCKFAAVYNSASSTTISNCIMTQFYNSNNVSNITLNNNFITGSGSYNYEILYLSSPITASTIKNNIFWGRVHFGNSNDISFFNNTVIAAENSVNIVRGNLSNSLIYNNIIINHSTYVNYNVSDDVAANRCLDAVPSNNNTIINNVFSCAPRADYTNSVFNATLEGTLMWSDAASIEEQFRHLANSPAVGAGTNGTTCGAYGAVAGERPYTPAGIPQYRPYIIDATVSDRPSENNTVNASFKIKVQQ